MQDKNAPQSPDELENSDFKNIMGTVPGNVEIDLERDGIIEDPRIGTNVYDLQNLMILWFW